MDNCRKGTYPHVPTDVTRGKVSAFCCAGFTHERIAQYFDISVDTLKKYYPDELRTAQSDKLGDITKVAFQRALDGNDKMLELILRTQARWANPQPVQEIVHTTKAALTEHVKSRGLEVLRETSDAGDNADAE